MRIGKHINISKKKILIGYVLLILLIKLVLVTGVRVWSFCDNQYDDGMMIKDAANLIAGNWLGQYDQYIFAKGITFPLYLNLIHKIGLPFLFSNVLLCFAASITFVIAIKKIIPNLNALAIIYTLLMFNPIAATSWTLQRAYRDSIYSYLVVILFSLIIAIYLNRESSFKKLLCYNLGAGFFLSAVWLAREDSPWVAPFVVVALLVTGIFIFFDKKINKQVRIKKILTLMVTPIFLVISILTVSTINYRHYGVFMTNEYTGGYLPKLFKELTIIKPDKWMADVPIPKSTREKAYKVSPTFSKLKNTLENHAFVATQKGGNASCSMLAWAVIDSVQWYGLKDARSAQQFYKQSYEEISAAIKAGKLQTRGGYIFMFESPWDNRYIRPLIKSLGETFRMTVHMSAYEYKPLSVENMDCFGNNNQIRQLEYLTNNLSYYKGEKISSHQTKAGIINYINSIYYNLNSYLFFIGVLGYLYILVRFILSIRKKEYVLGQELLILTGLFLSYFLRIFLISYTDVCSIFMKYPMYLAPGYWLVLMFTFTSIFISLRDLIKHYHLNKKII